MYPACSKRAGTASSLRPRLFLFWMVCRCGVHVLGSVPFVIRYSLCDAWSVVFCVTRAIRCSKILFAWCFCSGTRPARYPRHPYVYVRMCDQTHSVYWYNIYMKHNMYGRGTFNGLLFGWFFVYVCWMLFCFSPIAHWHRTEQPNNRTLERAAPLCMCARALAYFIIV